MGPGIVIEKQTMRDFTKEFPNTIYISTSEIKDEDGKRISDYDIKWHTLHPGETYTSQDIQKAKNEMDKLLEDSKKELNEKIENLKSELEEKTKLSEEQTKRAEQNSREKRKLTRKLEFSKIGTFNEQIKTAKAFAQSKAHEIKLQKELQKKRRIFGKTPP